MPEAASQPESDIRVESATRLRSGVVPADARVVDAILVGALAAGAFFIGSLVWPLFPGRDAQTYLMYYLEMGRANPVFPALMLFRTPGAPLFFGPALTTGHPLIVEVMLGAAFVMSIVSIYLIGTFWSRKVGLGTALVLLLYPAYNAIYHQVSSDGLFAFALTVWVLLFCAAVRDQTTRKFVLVGAFAFVLVMIRPGSSVLLILASIVMLFQRGSLVTRIRNTGAMIATGAVLLVAWAGYNKVRYGDFTMTRTAPLNVPFFRLFMMDRLIRPENGPASRALANAIETDLLPREPYRSYGVTLDYFLKAGQRNMLSDLGPMSDRVWGWDSDYEIIKRASREAIRSNPASYAKAVTMTAIKTLNEHSYAPVAPWPPLARTIRCELACSGPGTTTRNGTSLPAPFYPDETITTGHSYWLESTPDSSVSTDWSDLANPRLQFSSADKERAFQDLSTRLATTHMYLPPRKPVAAPMKIANLMTELLPPMWIWLLIGVAGLVRVRVDRRLLFALPAIGVAFIFINSLGLPGTQEYRLPFDPLFILFGVAGFVGVRKLDNA